MCHNVHHPKTHSVVLFTSRGGVFTLRNCDGRSAAPPIVLLPFRGFVRVNLIHLGNHTFLGNQFWDLTSAPLTKLQYLFSRSKSEIFVQAAHKNYCTRGACSETAIKTKY
jgi:hypothetical protein